MPGLKPHVLLHLALLFTSQAGEPICALPELVAQIFGGQLPLGPLHGILHLDILCLLAADPERGGSDTSWIRSSVDGVCSLWEHAL